MSCSYFGFVSQFDKLWQYITSYSMLSMCMPHILFSWFENLEQVLQAQFGSAKPPPYLVKWNLVRMAKRARKHAIDQYGQNLAFEVNEDHIPEEFLKGDILKHGKRHLIFATEEQLQLLWKAKSWYIDQTFQCCPKEFEQLFTISAFVSSEDRDGKQVPLVFVLMSSSKRKDYRKVKEMILCKQWENIW